MKIKQATSNITELEENIFVIPSGKGGSCNVYLLRGGRKNVLIDVGLPDDFDYLCGALGEIGLTLQDIHMVLISHEHYDHAGSLPLLPNHIVVAAHSRTANKFALNDHFSMMSGVFKANPKPTHVDILLEDGALIDIGDLRIKTIYTPGHCSGAVCFLEPSRGAIFTADTIFASGILGGIFASGNISDYINSLELLKDLRLTTLYPGHGRSSSTPYSDIDRAIEGSRALMRDTQTLFDSIDVGSAFGSIRSAAVDYSWRAAERRLSPRIPSGVPASIVTEQATHAARTINLSLHGILLDQEIPLDKETLVMVSLEGLGSFSCKVVSHATHHTRLRLEHPATSDSPLGKWIAEHRRDRKKAVA